MRTFLLKPLIFFDGGLKDETSMVVIHDDEFCFQPEVLQPICEDSLRSNFSLYAGLNLWDKPQLEQQKGYDGSFAPYYSGWLSVFSVDLFKDIALSPETMIFTNLNWPNAEDVQIGRWVQIQANREDRQRPVKYETAPNLASEAKALANTLK